MFVRRSRFTLAGIAGVLAFGAAACGSSSPSAPTVAADVTISMIGDRGSQSFAPGQTMMRVGQSVAWKNNDSTAHNALEDVGERFATGTFTYHCTIHPGMVGTLVVQ